MGQIKIILLGAAARARLRGGVLSALFSIAPTPTMVDSLADYPRWLVLACVTIVLAGAIWVLAKLLKWTLWLLLGAVLLTGLGTAAWMFWR